MLGSAPDASAMEQALIVTYGLGKNGGTLGACDELLRSNACVLYF
jgi:hypothetical protein